ncbi:MAG TPA: undecaprenyl-diphosphate phosphatase [Solirubrobacteraceae bacterium]|jgi:undecaprenyl-diphosphatase|nr:undecaprenyl-diphosphate phosphatase [Solirubrobacteraceae bacterium]
MRELPLRHAAILGLLHGPTELLPISSSAHTTLIPWLADWPYEELDPSLRKSFEVALHAGTALALLLRPPHERQGMRRGFLVAALAPPALAGYMLGGQIERRLGAPTKIAYGLLAGSAAMGGVEVYKKWHAPRARGGHRHFESNTTPAKIDATRPTTSDGLALGVAQALALMPGVSRSGATLAAARARGFSRQDADQLSWTVGLPVIAGATLLQGTRLARQQARADRSRATAMALAVGAASAFSSTLASSKALNRRRRARLLPACIAYRGALAAHVIRCMRDNTS